MADSGGSLGETSASARWTSHISATETAESTRLWDTWEVCHQPSDPERHTDPGWPSPHVGEAQVGQVGLAINSGVTWRTAGRSYSCMREEGGVGGSETL